MDDKIIKSLFNYAAKDKVNNMSIAYLNLNTNILVKEHYNSSTCHIEATAGSLYEIGSLTKLFTSLAFGILKDNAEINIENSVKYYLGRKVSDFFNEITIKQLITHTSGLPRLPNSLTVKMGDHKDPYNSLLPSDLYEFLLNPNEISTNRKYNYSNLGYGILAEILSNISQKSYFESVKELILDPLKMSSTSTIDKVKNSKMLINGYQYNNAPTPHWHNEVLAGAGCLISTLDDMTIFLMANLRNIANTPNLVALTDERLSNKMTYGWHLKNGIVSKLLGYSDFLWHNGMTGGFSSFICYSKSKKCGLIILANKAINLDSYFYNYSSFV
jgi:CubicO group peptidase (beta-lactamase class C family)